MRQPAAPQFLKGLSACNLPQPLPRDRHGVFKNEPRSLWHVPGSTARGGLVSAKGKELQKQHPSHRILGTGSQCCFCPPGPPAGKRSPPPLQRPGGTSSARPSGGPAGAFRVIQAPLHGAAPCLKKRQHRCPGPQRVGTLFEVSSCKGQSTCFSITLILMRSFSASNCPSKEGTKSQPKY